MSVIFFLLLLLSVFLSGYALSSFVTSNFIEKLGLSWIVGTVFLTFSYFILNAFLKVPINLINLLVLTTLFTGISLIRVVVAHRKTFVADFFKLWHSFIKIYKTDPVSLLFLVIIVVIVTHTFIQNIYWPVYDWDALALYDFRAKVFVHTGFMTEGVELGYFYHYPPYTSLLHAFTYLTGSTSARIWYSLLYFSILACFYAVLRKTTNSRTALLGTVLLAICPRVYGQSQAAYTNLAYSGFAALGFIYLSLWLRLGSWQDLLKGALLIGFSTWVRTAEPFWIVALLLCILGLIKYPKHYLYATIALLFIFFFKHPWLWYVAKLQETHVTNPVTTLKAIQLDASLSQFINRVGVVLNFLRTSVLPEHKTYIPALCVVTLATIRNREVSKIWSYLLYFVLIGVIAGGTLLFSYLFEGWTAIPDSAARMAIVLFPYTIYLIADSNLWDIILPRTKTKKLS